MIASSTNIHTTTDGTAPSTRRTHAVATVAIAAGALSLALPLVAPGNGTSLPPGATASQVRAVALQRDQGLQRLGALGDAIGRDAVASDWMRLQRDAQALASTWSLLRPHVAVGLRARAAASTMDETVQWVASTAIQQDRESAQDAAREVALINDRFARLFP